MTQPGEPPDGALAARAADGDERAFSVLVRRHKEPLYRLLRRYLGDSDEAYEAAHEAFISAWTHIRRFDQSRSFQTWLRAIAINKARDRGRRIAFRRLFFGVKSLEDSGVFDEPDPSASVEESVADQQDAAALAHCIANLPTPLKEALLLTAFDGLSQREAAEVLSVSEKTIETRVYRARKILAETIDPSLRPKS